MLNTMTRRAHLLLATLTACPLMAAGIDPQAATDAYLATLPKAAQLNTNAYFEGQYWMLLTGLLYVLGIAWLMLGNGRSAKLRDAVARRISKPLPRTLVYVLLYSLIAGVLMLPWNAYEDFFRERAYGFAEHGFGAWFGEWGIGWLITAAVSAIGVTALYSVGRRVPKTWPLWGSGVTVIMLAIAVMLSPVYIKPLFNTYKPLAEGPVKAGILQLAQANGVPTHEVWEFDASKQTNKVSANVSGFAGTTRISLNDNLLKQCTPAEIRAVMAHEIGHFVLNHSIRLLVYMSLVIGGGYLFVALSYAGVSRRFGKGWQIGDITDEAGLPLVVALLSAYMFLATPIVNSIIRNAEIEADLFSLNAAREPDGFAKAILKTAAYRKAAPGKWEEILFYDHPAPQSRILMAMRWKAAQPPTPQP